MKIPRRSVSLLPTKGMMRRRAAASLFPNAVCTVQSCAKSLFACAQLFSLVQVTLKFFCVERCPTSEPAPPDKTTDKLWALTAAAEQVRDILEKENDIFREEEVFC